MRNRLWFGVLCLVVSACGSSGSAVVVDVDAGADAASDLGADLGPADAGPLDAGTPPEDATPRDAEAPADLGMDAPVGDTGPRACTGNTDCAGNAAGPVCDTASGRCVACLPSDDVCPRGQFCDTTTRACVPGCRDDEACAVGVSDGGVVGAPTRCDRTTRQCVECVTNEHCPAGTLCVGNVCVMGCNPERPCPTGQTCCDGACIDPLANVVHCGACGARCSVANATAACRNGRCAVGQCTAPYGDCDNDPANGCETDTQRTVSHCGACGTVCTAPSNATATCVGGTCGFTCAAGFADCDGNAANGCEVDTRTDVTHCGRCAARCNPPNAAPTCVMGECRVDFCADGFGNCDGNPTNGCEVDTRTSVSHCGACGTACTARDNAFPGCLGGRCVTSCVMGFQDCDADPSNGCEADLRTSTTHCGACGRGCAPRNGEGACAAGRCTLTRCDTGFADCDGNVDNGCETDTRTSPAHCGRCGNACMTSGGTPVCRAGVCGVGACAMGRGDCDGQESNGCETDTQSSATHCGACGRGCSLPNATASCAAGRCAVAACSAGFADCDGNPDNGCEVDTRSTATACGACGVVCSVSNGAPACVGGRCAVAACNAGFADCDGQAGNGCETNLGTSPSACGACGAVCNVSNGTAGCASGRCTVASCAQGYADCNANAADGCETRTDTDPRACGACGRACALPNAVAGCAGGACVVAACSAGFADCDGQAGNGCEVDLRSNATHCGACGVRCASGSCREGACQVFGGAFETSDPPCPSCNNANPLGGGCGCPSGYTPQGSFRTINDCRGQGTQQGATIVTCASAGPSDWAGGYQRDDAVPCGRGCRTANPYTGGCGCPGGTTPVEFRTLTDTTCGGIIGSAIGVCVRTGGARPSFGGAYQVDDNVPGGIGCRAANPVTGGCSCPSGFSPSPLRVEVDSSRGFIGSVVYFCAR